MTIQQRMLNSTARSAIVSTFCNALDTAENTGSLVTQVCNIAHKYLGGEQIHDDDMAAMVNDIAKNRGWKDRVRASRVSEVKRVLYTYQVLPEAIEAYSAKAKKCDWHTSLKLARALGKTKFKVKPAVHMVLETANKGPSAVPPQGRVAAGLKAWYKVSKSDKRAVIVKAAALLSTIGLKLELE